MDALMIRVFLVAALGALVCRAAPVSGSLEVFVRSPVSVRQGHTTTLPCWFNPPQSTDGLEVRWYRALYSSPVMFYRAKPFENASQEASYAGRVSFGLKDAASAGLTAGDVSLRLDNARIEDEGDYTCYVSSERGYDRASVSLIVTELGNAPLLSAVWKDDNMVNISCESKGWYPEPELQWLAQNQVLIPESLKTSNEASGLWSVHSWLLVSSSTEVSCSVGISGEEKKEAHVRLENHPQPGAAGGGWVAFGLLLIAILLLLLGVVYYFKRISKEKKDKSGNDHTQEKQKLLPKEGIQPTDLSTASKCYVNVTLADTGNKYLMIRGAILRDAPCVFPDGDKVTCVTAIKGTPAFSSGQHYWEVSLGKNDPNVGIKQSWWVGVTSATVIPENYDFSPTTSNGFWFLSSSHDSFQLSTESNVTLPVHARPQTVGVYLNRDSGELSFYNVDNNSLIGSLTATFTGAVFPLFNPGKGDKAPMTIVQKKERGQPDGTENAVDSAVNEAEA